MASSVANPTDGLQVALGEFQSILSDEDRQRLQRIKNKPEADAAIQFTATLDQENAAKRKGYSISSRLYSVLLSVQQFSNVVDTFVSANPSIAALVWGTMKLTMLIVTNFLTYYEETSKAFLDFDKWSPRLSQYQSLFPTSTRLQTAICEFNASIIRCCKQIVLISQRSWQAHVVNSLTQSFQSELGNHIRLIKDAAREVSFEIDLAKAQSDIEEQRLQQQERASALGHRFALTSFISKSNAEMVEAKKWRAIVDGRNKSESNQQRLDDISTFDYVTAFNQARSKRYHSTGGWVFQTSEWRNWKDEDGSIGSGKTVLSRQVSESISFFFPRFDYADSLLADSIIRSLIKQNLQPDLVDRLSNDISKAYSSFYSQDSMLDLLVSKTAIFSTNYLLIDSLDECELKERQTILQILGSMIKRSSSRVKIFVASRDALENEITDVFPQVVRLQMNTPEAASDLELFVRQTLSERINMGQLAIGNVSSEMICDSIMSGAQGMFLWVALEIDEICAQVCEEDVLIALQNLPKTLTEILTRALLRILAQGNHRIAKEVFKWISVAKRPLLLEELQDALSIRIGESYSKLERRPQRIEKLPAWCANLVEIDEVSNSVQFVHHSVRTFILDTSIVNLQSPKLNEFHDHVENFDTAVGELCVTYLEWNDFKRALEPSKPQLDQTTKIPEPQKIIKTVLTAERKSTFATTIGRLIPRSPRSEIQLKLNTSLASRLNGRQKQGLDENLFHNRSYPFLEYARKYWISHTRLLMVKSPIYWSWRRMLEGTHQVARTEWTRSEYRSADEFILAWAQTHCHFALLYALMSAGHLDFEQFHGHSCKIVAESQSIQGMQILLENIEEFTPRHWTREMSLPVKIATVAAYLKPQEHIDSFRRTQDWHVSRIYRPVTPLLDNRPNIDVIASIPGLLEITYFASVQLNLAELMATLLVREPSLCDIPRGCIEIQPLQVAIMAENITAVNLLLQRGADPNQSCSKPGWLISTLRDFRFNSLLNLAISQKNTMIMRLLLDSGSDVNYSKLRINSPRNSQPLDSTTKMIQSCLTNFQTNLSEDLTALHCAVLVSTDNIIDGPDLAPMKLLLSNGADSNVPNSEGLTPIFLAVHQRQPKTLKALLKAGADPTLKCKSGQTAEEYAAQIRYHEAKGLIKKYLSNTPLVIAYGERTGSLPVYDRI
ncbi:hypothetical protein FHL15_005919 [Xylaria flabelliformis]|uniref:Uncharacterized protein n=1 Tax=Xylaria flabelliformis TaxID=2512241 RepID=A0A553HYM1_9PEZI|nr:hypothetical protein FHL15_005919 [Xylaria flabelliformis]